MFLQVVGQTSKPGLCLCVCIAVCVCLCLCKPRICVWYVYSEIIVVLNNQCDNEKQAKASWG